MSLGYVRDSSYAVMSQGYVLKTLVYIYFGCRLTVLDLLCEQTKFWLKYMTVYS